ncbi:description family protein [Lyngbya aestuarii BL J]|uniref:Description family protein n=1 Tax=Lyngbya aestuarii BL J TaxID=1348334 RepID=U7QAE2_9CYAN|nr:FG-GAP-like repeat-containing protein [Lyngbya aestuarii]ERT04809.1 description family protein [Lyngbya aestuarii BL J]
MNSFFNRLIRNQKPFLNSPLGLCLLLASLSWGCVERSSSQAVNPSNSNSNPQKINLDLPPLKEGKGGLIVADVNNDQQKDFLVTHPNAIAVYDHSGKKLWVKSVNLQLTNKSESQGLPGLHAPGIQAGDINGDDKTEVLFLSSDHKLHIVEGKNGKTIREIQLKSPDGSKGWEHLVIANFRGKGDRDLLLQTTNANGYRVGRYIAAYSVDDLLKADNPQPLWERDDFKANAHNGVRVADLNGDNLDEVLGAKIVSPEGEILIEIPRKGHIDSLFVADVRPDIPGLEVVVLEEGGEKKEDSKNSAGGLKRNRVFLYNTEKIIWETHYKNWEPQNAAVGDFDPNRPGLEIWSRSRFSTDQKPFVFDAKGKVISNYTLNETKPEGWTKKGVEVIFPIDWTGEDRQLAVAKERHTSGNVGIFDAMTGEFVLEFPENADRLYVADVKGDWREEIMVINGNKLHIYENTDPNPNPNRSSLWTQNHYRRSKMTWNYYSP